MISKFKYQWYQQIYESLSEIIAEAEAYGKELGLNKLASDIGLYAGSSARPGNLPPGVKPFDELSANGKRTFSVRGAPVEPCF